MDDARSELRASRSVTLPADLTSAGRARAVLREVLGDTGDVQWLEAAELAVSEVVSNAVLHAHTDMELTVEVSDHLRVCVRDRSPVLPVQRSYDTSATTGRGMALVAALTSQHGIADAGPAGKTVWFTVTGDPAEQTEEELLAAWDDAEWDLDEPAAASVEATTTVRLVDLPPTLWLAARQHHDALIRELVLYTAEHGELDVDIAAADAARSTISTEVWEAVERARQEGTARPALPEGHPSPLPWVPDDLSLELRVPEGLGPAFSAMQDTLDAAERLAKEGRLLARPGLPEVVAVRDWACEQVVAQLAGIPPKPWPGTSQERFLTEVNDMPGEVTGWDVQSVVDSDRGVVAADDANRIVAISRPLAAALGWEVDDIVGRRVVALIPPRLREGHVAGFTRHLSTGEAYVLGVPLVLPVLKADGTELSCRFLIEQASASGGRSVYIAWIEPADEAEVEAGTGY